METSAERWSRVGRDLKDSSAERWIRPYGSRAAPIVAQDVALRAKRSRTLRPVRPSMGLKVAYRNKLDCLICEMNRSVLYWIKASFRANEPEVSELAADALPATELRKAVRRLARRWQRQFNEAAPELARWFSGRSYQRSTRSLQQILKKGGWTVNFKMSPAQRDIFLATVHENVSLIKSIPSQYFTQIEGMVMRSVQTGRDLHQLTNDLQRQFGVTRKRAVLIARDQSNKVNAAFTRARHIELGVTQALWMHSGGGKHPRPTHVANSGKPYDVKQGWFDPAVRRWIHPGQEINCRCISRPVIPGFS